MATKSTIVGLMRLVETYGRHYQHGTQERRERRAQVKAYATQLLNEHSSGELAQISRQLSRMEKLIMATRAENAAAVAALAAQVRKAHAEIVAKIAALEDAMANSGNTSPEEDAAMADLKAAVQGADDIVLDPPAP